MFANNFFRKSWFVAIQLLIATNLIHADQYDQYFHNKQVVNQYMLYSTWYWVPYLSITDVPVGKKDDVNPNHEYESFRVRYRWNVSSIPDNATISSATLYISSIASSNKPNTNFVRFFVRSSSNTDWDQFNQTAWQNLAGGTQYNQLDQPTGVYQTVTLNYVSGSTFCNAIKSSLSSDYFLIALRVDGDESWGTGLGTVHSIQVKKSGDDISTAVRLVINYTVPDPPPNVYNVAVRNNFDGGSLKIGGTLYTNVPLSGITNQWQANSVHVLEAIDNQDVGGYVRVFEKWTKGASDFATTLVTSTSPVTATATYTANFLKLFNVSVTQAQFIEPGSGGSYEVDGVDVGPNWLGTIRQNSSKTLEAVPPMGFIFAIWSDGVTANPRNLSPTDHVPGFYAIYKLPLHSTSLAATAYNNSRKVAKWQSSLWFAVYESANIIWFTESSDTGQTWSEEIPLSEFSNVIYPARNPAIAVTSTGIPHVVWEIYKGDGYRVMYRYKNYGLWSLTRDLTPDQFLIAYPSSLNEQTPSIAAGDVVAAVWSHNGHLAFAIDPQLPASQSFGGSDPYNLGTVAFPSIASGYPSASSSSFDFVWSEGANKQIFLQTIIRDNITGSVTFSDKINLVSSYPFLSNCNNPSISVTGLNKYISFSANDSRYTGGTTRSINYIQIYKNTNTIVDYRSWGQPNIISDYPSITYNSSFNKVIITFSDVTNRISMWVDNTTGSVPKVLQTGSQNPLTIEMDNPVMTFLLTSGDQAPYKLQFKKQQLTTVVSNVDLGWNLNSVPVDVWNFAKNAVWSASNSLAYWFQPGVGYVIRDTLENRLGYWIKFPSNQSVSYYGVPIESLHISVKTGWNMIGSTSIPFDTTKIYPVGTARISSIYKYQNGGYSIADTIKPGSGYWIKVSTNGILVLNSSTPGSTTPGSCQNNEPPPPPSAPTTPTLSSPANGTTGVSIYPTLTWNTSEGASNYILQVASDICFNYIVFRDSTLTTTSKQIGPLYYSSTYYWRVKASIGNLRSDWSAVRYFVTQSAPGGSDPCEPYASLSATDQFNVSDASGNNQSFYVRNGSKPFIPNFGTLDMPPEPLKGIFKARFKSDKFIETIFPDKVSKKIPIIIKDAQYPVEFSWIIKDDNKINYWVINPDNNKKIQLSASGKITINDKKGGELVVEALARQPICLQPVYKISEGENIQLPTTYHLSQNYPNPFNPETQISYALPEAGYVTLKVYDVLGREVATLVDEFKDAGYYEATWDATNIPSGVYFYKLTAGSFRSVKKAILMK